MNSNKVNSPQKELPNNVGLVLFLYPSIQYNKIHYNTQSRYQYNLLYIPQQKVEIFVIFFMLVMLCLLLIYPCLL